MTAETTKSSGYSTFCITFARKYITKCIYLCFLPVLAAVPGFALLLGILSTPVIMAKFGRKVGSIVSIISVLIGWFCIFLAQNVVFLHTARLLQGLSMGMSTSVAPILISEYTSRKNRGSFLASMGLSMSIMTFMAHSLGMYLTWQKTAVACAAVSLVSFIIALMSPESPSWLAEQGRYEQCKEVFQWLRGDDEDDELLKIIEAGRLLREAKKTGTELSLVGKAIKSVVEFKSAIRKTEFYKPIFIVIHMYMIAHLGGINLLTVYTLDTIKYVIGESEYNKLLVVTLDIQRIVSNAIAIFVIRRVKRRAMLFVTMTVNILVLVGTGLYALAKMNDRLLYDHIIFGPLLLHLHALSVVTGSLTIPMVISGEIFPMKYKSLASGICDMFSSFIFSITVKTVPFLFATVNVHGTYFIYAALLTYCFVIAWFYLPETKDRSLQDIEEEFKTTICK